MFSQKLVGFLSPILIFGIVAAVGSFESPSVSARNSASSGGWIPTGDGCPCGQDSGGMECGLTAGAGCFGIPLLCDAGQGYNAGVCHWQWGTNACTGPLYCQTTEELCN